MAELTRLNFIKRIITTAYLAAKTLDSIFSQQFDRSLGLVTPLDPRTLASNPDLYWHRKVVGSTYYTGNIENVIAAMLDTGFSFTVTDSEWVSSGSKVLWGSDYSGTQDENDGANHGNCTAGIVGLNALGSIIYSQQCCGQNGAPTGEPQRAQAIKDAIDRYNADVILVNIGGSVGVNPWAEEAIEYAQKMGRVIFAAAGNSNGDSPLEPANLAKTYNNVIAVSSIGKDLRPALYTNLPGGIKNAVMVPGNDIYTFDNKGRRALFTGTSAANSVAVSIFTNILSEARRINPKATQMYALEAFFAGCTPFIAQNEYEVCSGIPNQAKSLELIGYKQQYNQFIPVLAR